MVSTDAILAAGFALLVCVLTVPIWEWRKNGLARCWPGCAGSGSRSRLGRMRRRKRRGTSCLPCEGRTGTSIERWPFCRLT